jgi:hypothetical protein
MMVLLSARPFAGLMAHADTWSPPTAGRSHHLSVSLLAFADCEYSSPGPVAYFQVGKAGMLRLGADGQSADRPESRVTWSEHGEVIGAVAEQHRRGR